MTELEHPRGEGPDAAGQEHVAQLRDRRVRQHLLDVVLHQADRSREEGRETPDHSHDEHRVGREAEQHVAARHHIDARRHHRRRVDQRGDGRGPGHGVRQPDVEGKLGRLAAGSEEEEQADERRVRRETGGVGGRRGEDLAEVERAKQGEYAEDPQDESEVADAVDDEGLLAGIRRRLLVVVVPDQEVRAEPDPLPPDEHQQEVVGQNQHQHREHEEVQIREVPSVALVVTHVAHGIDVDQEADEGDEGDHQGRKGIETEGGIHEPLGARTRDLADGLVEAERDPAVERDHVRRAGSKTPEAHVEDRSKGEEA